MSQPGRIHGRKLITAIVSVAVFPLCIRYVFVSFQWSRIIEILQHADLVWLLAGCILSILVCWFLRACRWSIILGNLGFSIKLSTLCMCSAVSLSMALVTPAQSGEMLKVELLKKRGLMARFPGYSSFLLERYIDFCVIVVLALFGLSGRMAFVRRETLTLFLGITLATLLAAIIVAFKVRFTGRISEMQNWLRACVKNPTRFFLILFLTVSSWTVIVFGWEICLHSTSIKIGFYDSMTLMSVMTVIDVLSFIPGGEGVLRAALQIFLFTLDIALRPPRRHS